MASVRIAHMLRDEVMERLGKAGMGTSCERAVLSSRKQEHLPRTGGEGDEVRDERQS